MMKKRYVVGLGDTFLGQLIPLTIKSKKLRFLIQAK